MTDDGSRDRTREIARKVNAIVVRSGEFGAVDNDENGFAISLMEGADIRFFNKLVEIR